MIRQRQPLRRSQKPLKRSRLKPRTKRIRAVSAKQRKKIAVRRKWRAEQWDQGNRDCGICHRPIVQFEDSTVDHVEPGYAKVDNPSNWQMAHGLCNQIKGSRRNFKIDGGQDGN